MYKQVGVIGASTPFITGEPYALFCQQEILGGGIVGFASYNDQPVKELEVKHTSLEPLGDLLTITRYYILNIYLAFQEICRKKNKQTYFDNLCV